ncbi:MAG: GNAT family N-acetyltransferase [Anaeroplasmataceae bacterium]
MIRRAKNTDIERLNCLLYQVHRIHSEGRPDIFKSGMKKYSDDELLEIISDDNKPIYVYTNDEDIVVGYAFCIINEYKDNPSLVDRKELYIDDLCVDSNIRGKGIGKALYNYVLLEAQRLSCYHVTLNVWCLNESALCFYKSIGLNPLKVYMEKIL